jgi:hypothetical protein
VCIVLVGKAKGKRMFGKHMYEGEDNLEMDLTEIWPGSCNNYHGRTKTRMFCCENILEFFRAIRCEKFID